MKFLLRFMLLVLAAQSILAAGLPDPVRFSSALETGDLRAAREWLDQGLHPDYEGHTIGTGLMIGAWEGNIPLMELFLARGADINKFNHLGEQAVHHASWRGKLPAVRWLVERGARLNREGKEWTALHYAVFAGHADVVNYLLERGADINALSNNGSTPLMMAAREGHEAIARSLLAAGARRDIVNEQGENALHWAMRHRHLGIAREIGGREEFAAVVARPATSWGTPVRSQPVPDRADSLMAQARSMEAAGRREEALRLYRAALTAIRQADAVRKVPPRAASGLVITARRDQPEAQTASLSYATSSPSIAAVGAGSTAHPAEVDASDEWLRRARELESAGKRAEALQAYRQAAAALRAAGTPDRPSLPNSPDVQRVQRPLPPP